VNQPFEIRFDFPLANSDMNVSLRARAELHHSDPYYVVDDFRFAQGRRKKNNPSSLSLLPKQEIILAEYGASKQWVHRDSGRPSLLSISMGKAIEKTLGSQP